VSAAAVQAPASVLFPGTAVHAAMARDFARRVLGPGHPAAGTVDLLTTELFTNAIVHTRSGLPGGTVTVTIRITGDAVVVTVLDQGSPDAPLLAAAGALDEHGRGLRLVDVLADDWGTAPDHSGRAVWFRCGGQR
jgi:anti-sigma regulatory factor (Ser/Thr protein kinase)